MKRKIVLWGTNEKDEKILVALELLDQENKVMVYTFEQAVATEAFYNAMLNEWREDKEVEFPAHQKIERPLSVSEQILPEEIKVDRTDLISRAQAEWHFVVLSAKLYQMYKSEVEDFTDMVDQLTSFDNAVWNDLKNFWGKVQEQVYEKNLFREHAASLKNRTNELFDKLKELKKTMEKELNEASSKHKETIMTELADIEERVEKGLGLKPIFEELKELQARIKKMDFNSKHRRQVWDKIDAAFKAVKEKRFGDKPKSGNNPLERLKRRYDGLVNAIDKMEKSIKRDRDDQAWQNKRANTTDGQLEMQIRQAKIKMIDERIKSKQEKLDDMLKTKSELEDRMKKEEARAAQKQKDAEIQKAKKEAAEAAKEKIANEIKSNTEQLQEKADELKAAAAEIAESKTKKQKAAPTTAEVKKEVSEAVTAVAGKLEEAASNAGSFLDQISESIGDTIEDVIDTVKAVAEVVEDKIETELASFKSEEE